MNKKLQEFARSLIKDGLSKCTDGQKSRFLKMYGRDGRTIDDVVDNMPESKLDLAMTQVGNTVKKRAKK